MRIHYKEKLDFFQIARRYEYKGYAIFLRKNLSDGKLADLWKADELFPNENAALWMPKKKNGEWNSDVVFMNLPKLKTDTLIIQELPEVFNGY